MHLARGLDLIETRTKSQIKTLPASYKTKKTDGDGKMAFILLTGV